MDVEMTIERYADQGRCVGHVDGRVVFVRFALPGEKVRVTLDEPHDRADRFWTGEVSEVLEASPDRVEPVWPLAGPVAQGGGVGGADLIHVSLPGQLAWKKSVIDDQMKRMGHVDTDVDVVRAPGDEAPGDAADKGGKAGLHWRTRIELIADDEGMPSMRRRGSHVRVPISDMPLATERVLDVAAQTRLWEGGFEPGSQIRVVAPEPRGNAARPFDAKATANAHRTDADAPDYALMIDGRQCDGRRLLTEDVDVTLPGTGELMRFSYCVDCAGFWQVHRLAPNLLVQHVLDLTAQVLRGTGSACIWDLFSGSGLFTLPLALTAAPRVRMLSVEGAANAVRNAQRNLDRYHVRGVDAYVGDVARTLRTVPSRVAHPDLVVLDPPRAGARAEVCRRVMAAGPRGIIYVACDPTSLARDTATLTSGGYRLAHIRAYDIYPMTHHVETIALFTR
ncbi:MAG: RsmD family RNA methyltransferase [Bifidobacteriaceae bacterium]|nr:RsmD family RNA methyltransferase [Bifidobacteriaceae bacterium]